MVRSSASVSSTSGILRAASAAVGALGPLALLSLVCALSSACSETTPPLALDIARPPIILITLDTTRADRLSCYGYPRRTSPRLDELCTESTVFTQAYSTTSWTLPAHASLFTGAYTYSHGARYDVDGPLVLSDVIDHSGAHRYRARGLAPGTATLASRLADAGYATAGFVAGPWMKRVFGLDWGFSHWDDSGIDHENGRRAEALTDAALDWVHSWLRESQGEQPIFLFLNYYDAHSPYEPPASHRDRFADQVGGGGPLPGPGEGVTLEQANALYDAEIAYADEHLGRLLDGLRDAGLYEAAWIVVTADHGDVIGEHGTAGHGRYLWEEEIRVPMIVKRPATVGAAERQLDNAAFQLNDVAPLLLSELGLKALPASGGPRTRSDDAVIAELYPLPIMFAKGDWRAFIVGDDKLMWNSRERHKLHDLGKESGEDVDRAATEVGRRDALLKRLDETLRVFDEFELSGTGSSGASGAVDDETRRALESLGYVDDAASLPEVEPMDDDGS
ncbi:MAG: sulfatase [Myxococcota bacterium]|nr:sulfatase [Myxococcota bacterium]